MLNQVDLANANIALFYNSAYVDVGPDIGDEATNVLQSLQNYGHSVSTFTGTSAASWIAATQNRDILVIPELDAASLNLDPAAAAVIAKFVMSGGTLVTFGHYENNNANLLNYIFNTNIANTRASTSSTKTGEATGTTFTGESGTLSDNNRTESVDPSNLPTGAESYYNESDGDSTAFSFQVGKGQVTVLGWDWYDSFPPQGGGQDGGWQGVLDAAISLTDGDTSGNTIKGTKKNDKVTLTKALKGKKATDLDDYVKLKKGNDKAKLGDGNDMAYGAKGKDKIIGQDGNDWIAGQQDNDVLKGGAGYDCFYFDKKLSKAGTDYIKDFTISQDMIVLKQKHFSDLSLGNVSNADFNAYFNVTGDGYVEYKGDEFIRLKQATAASINEQDFVVVA